MNSPEKNEQRDCIVVGVDGSDTARVAAGEAAEMARRYERPLHVVMAVPRMAHNSKVAGSEELRVSSVELAEQQLLRLAADLRGEPRVPVTTAVVVDDPATALCNEARSLGASVIFVGNKRTQGATRFLGSVAGGVVKSAPCAVHIVHTFD